MAVERKKVDIPEVVVAPIAEPDKPTAPVIEAKPKKSEDKYIRIALNATAEERKEITDKLAKGELKMGYFADDNGVAYHYYLVVKK